MNFSLFSAVLFSIGWMSFVESGDGREASCCLTVKDTRIPVEKIEKYEMQDPTAICSLRAVRFYTKMSKVICSDPDSEYAKRVMKIVDGRTATKPTMCSTSTTNTIATVTTTNKTQRTQTETSSTTTSQIVTRIETSTPETETSTSTTASRNVTRIETSSPETETSTSTTASRNVTRIETSSPETVITKTTNQPTPKSKENPESSFSTAKICRTGGLTSPSTETERKTPGPATVTHLNTLKTTDNKETTSPMRTKPSKLKIKTLRKKSKKKLKKFQMNIHLKDKSG